MRQRPATQHPILLLFLLSLVLLTLMLTHVTDVLGQRLQHTRQDLAHPLRFLVLARYGGENEQGDSPIQAKQPTSQEHHKERSQRHPSSIALLKRVTLEAAKITFVEGGNGDTNMNTPLV
jgi:hypothetical protein